EEWFKAEVCARHGDQSDLTAPRVDVPGEVRHGLSELRRVTGVSSRALCASIGIRQPVTFYAWEKGLSRPTLAHFRTYLRAIGADSEEVFSRATVGRSRLEQIWGDQYRGSGRNVVRDFVRLSDLDPADLDWFASREDLELTPEHYASHGIPRFIAVDEALMTLLGFGTISGNRVVFTTSSYDIASGIVYALSSLGVVPSISEHQPDGVVRTVRGLPCETKHRYWSVGVCAKEDLRRLQPVWKDHPRAAVLEDYLETPGAARRFEAIDGDLMAVPVTSIEEVAPSNGEVYDFSVEGDENFIAGMGGVCC